MHRIKIEHFYTVVFYIRCFTVFYFVFMKNLLYKGMLLLAFCGFVASCAQNEEIEEIEVASKEFQKVTFTTHFVAASRAVSVQENMELFYTVYSSTGAVVEKNSTKLQSLSTDGDTSITLTLQLEQGLTYDIAFWAQPQGLDCYDISNLKSVKIDYAKCLANNAYRKAYYGSVSGLGTSQQSDVTVSLKSPFGKIEVLTTEEDVEAASALGFDFNNLNSSMTVKGAATVFNALYGTAEGEKTTISLIPNTIPGETKKSEGKSYRVLASEYILCNDQEPVEVSVELSKVDSPQDKLSFDAGKAFLQSEYVFSLYGHYLTTTVDFNVTVDSSFDSSYVF